MNAPSVTAEQLARPASSNDTDQALMARYCAGDPGAFEQLYLRHNRALYRFIAWQSPRTDWTDEIVQDTWLRLHAARGRYLPQAGFRTFLYQIARNRLIDLLRQKSAVLACELRDDNDDGDSLFDRLSSHVPEPDSPEDALDRRQQSERLLDAVHALPRQQKEALILHQFSELPLEEIAAITGVPTETVKSRLRYAMTKLRQQLSPV